MADAAVQSLSESPRLDPMSLSGFEPLAPGARLLWILHGIVTVGVLTLIGAIVEVSLAHNRNVAWPMPWPRLVPGVALIGGGLLLLVVVTAAMLRYARFGYRLSEDDLIVQHGVLWRVRRCVPRPRVQHVDITSGPIDRAFGLVEVHVHVAGGMGAVAAIDGLSPDAAERLKEALIDSRTDGV